MSFSDKPREPRAPGRARPRLSLKMQAIGFLSRREHSRQELRAKLLESLRKRAREDAALEAAAGKAARELADALREQPSNGIDDAFAPPAPVATPTPTPTLARPPATRPPATRPPAARALASAGAGAGAGAGVGVGVGVGVGNATPSREVLDALSSGNGAPLPASLRASLVTPDMTALDTAASTTTPPSMADATVLAGPSNDDDLARTDPEAAVDQLLDWLVANKYLSEARFVESRVNAQSRKRGALLIKLELSRHGLALEPEQASQLRETEFARAQALWQRKFGELAPDARLRAKQARFLAARGFAADVVRRVVGGEEDF